MSVFKKSSFWVKISIYLIITRHITTTAKQLSGPADAAPDTCLLNQHIWTWHDWLSVNIFMFSRLIMFIFSAQAFHVLFCVCVWWICVAALRWTKKGLTHRKVNQTGEGGGRRDCKLNFFIHSACTKQSDKHFRLSSVSTVKHGWCPQSGRLDWNHLWQPASTQLIN